LAHLREALDLADPIGGDWLAAGPRVQLGVLAVLRGRLDEARPLLEEALVTATDCLEVAEDAAPVLGAHACLVMGRVALVEGDHATARERFERAAALLTAVGADRPAAQCWFELGALLQEVGEDQAAMDAYRRAAASTGLTIPDTSSVLV